MNRIKMKRIMGMVWFAVLFAAAGPLPNRRSMQNELLAGDGVLREPTALFGPLHVWPWGGKAWEQTLPGSAYRHNG